MKPTTTQRKVALITGAARRIGAQIASTLHEQGCDVIIHYQASKEEATMLAHQLNGIRQNSATLIAADLSDISAINQIIPEAIAQQGQLDILVNNASYFAATPLGETTLSQWQHLMDTNCKAAYFLSEAAVPFLRQTQGTIINILDVYAQRPLKNYAIYCASKAALTALTQALAHDLAPDIRVNAVAPGKIIWPEGENAWSEEKKQYAESMIPLQRHGHPLDVAKAVAFLALHAPYITGQILPVDGGSSIKPVI